LRVLETALLSQTPCDPLCIFAILECDGLVGETKKESGSIGNFYKKFLEAGASKLEESDLYERPNIQFSFYDVVNKQECGKQARISRRRETRRNILDRQP
jgi:hypothetical protein